MYLKRILGKYDTFSFLFFLYFFVKVLHFLKVLQDNISSVLPDDNQNYTTLNAVNTDSKLILN